MSQSCNPITTVSTSISTLLGCKRRHPNFQCFRSFSVRSKAALCFVFTIFCDGQILPGAQKLPKPPNLLARAQQAEDLPAGFQAFQNPEHATASSTLSDPSELLPEVECFMSSTTCTNPLFGTSNSFGGCMHVHSPASAKEERTCYSLQADA